MKKTCQTDNHFPAVVNEWKQEKSNPIDVFKLFWNDDIVDLIVLETNNYHQQKFGTELHVTKEEIYLVFGILILSGYVTYVPMYPIVDSFGQQDQILEILLWLNVA